jgi:hypothetical protein
MFEFILFVLIGLCLFLPMSERAKTAALVFYVVIMAIWLLIGVTGFNVGQHLGFRS